MLYNIVSIKYFTYKGIEIMRKLELNEKQIAWLSLNENKTINQLYNEDYYIKRVSRGDYNKEAKKWMKTQCRYKGWDKLREVLS